ncbi:MAG: methionyl-tRNA formyltransferase [Oligosphaeraceae bacterium]|nr:methionyl-tRNA formyltransferase [Oligosphaeraceae bacterium]
MSDGDPVRIYFLGSGRLGIPILSALAADPRIELLGIGSQCDKPYGRRKVITPTQLCQHALESGFTVDRIDSVNSPAFLNKLAAMSLDLIVVVSFGQILRQGLLDLPRFGCLNVHASLLPKYRGASPIAEALLNGDEETGVCFMKMDRGLDTGPVYETMRSKIDPLENAGQLEDRLGNLAAERIADVCYRVCREGLEAKPQPPHPESKAGKVSKEDGELNWELSAQRIARMIRAYNPWPRVHTIVGTQRGEKKIQIVEAVPIEGNFGDAVVPGQILPMRRDIFAVACGEGFLKILRLIPEGRKEMAADDFLRGNPLPPNCILSRKKRRGKN